MGFKHTFIRTSRTSETHFLKLDSFTPILCILELIFRWFYANLFHYYSPHMETFFLLIYNITCLIAIKFQKCFLILHFHIHVHPSKWMLVRVKILEIPSYKMFTTMSCIMGLIREITMCTLCQTALYSGIAFCWEGCTQCCFQSRPNYETLEDSYCYALEWDGLNFMSVNAARDASPKESFQLGNMDVRCIQLVEYSDVHYVAKGLWIPDYYTHMPSATPLLFNSN